MTTTIVNRSPNARLREIVRRQCDTSASIEDAVSATLEAIHAEPEVRDALIQQAIEQSVRSLVYQVQSEIRSAAKFQPGPTSINAAARRAARQSISVRLLDMPFGGRRLAEYTGAELDALITDTKAQARGLEMNIHLLEAVRKLVKDDQTVGDAVDDKKAESIRVKVFGK